MNAPPRQLTNSEAAIEDAHVGMHAHIKQSVDATLTKNVIDLRSTVRNHVAGCDGKQRRFPAPGAVLGISRSIASAIAVVDRQGRIVERRRLGRIDWGRALGELPAFGIRVEV